MHEQKRRRRRRRRRKKPGETSGDNGATMGYV